MPWPGSARIKSPRGMRRDLWVGYSPNGLGRQKPRHYGDMARIVLESAQAAVQRVRRMRQVESVNLIDLGIPGGPLLDDGTPSGY